MTITDRIDRVERRLEGWFAKRLVRTSRIRLTPLSGGYSNPTYLVELDERPDRFVLRWDPIVGPQAPYDMVGQYETFSALSKTAVPVPTPYWLETDLTIIGRVFWVCEFVDGESTGRLLDPAGPLTPARTESFINMLTRIHAVEWQQSSLVEVLGRVDAHATGKMIDAELHLYGGVPSTDLALFEAARSWLHANRPADFALCLNHGDCNFSNFLFQGSQINAVVDWELASITDPMADVGFYCALLHRYRPDTPLAIIEAERDHFLNRYRSLTGRSLATLPFWEAFCNYRYALSWTQKGLDHPNSGYAAYRDRMREFIPC